MTKLLGMAALLLVGTGCDSEKSGYDVHRVERSCVRFLCVSNKGESVGTGFLVGKNGEIVTNNHVIAGAKKIFIFHRLDGHIRVYEGSVIKRSAPADLAIVSSGIRATGLIINLTEPEKESEAHSIGFPGIVDNRDAYEDWEKIVVAHIREPALQREGVDITKEMEQNKRVLQLVDGTPTNGVVQRRAERPLAIVDDEGNDVKQAERDIDILEHNLDIRHGNSGGPLLDAGGYVIGVVGQGVSRGDMRDRDKVQFAISAPRELVTLLKEARVDFSHVEFDVRTLGKLNKWQKLGIAAGLAGLLTLLGISIFFGVRASKKRRSYTQVIGEQIQQALEGRQGSGDMDQRQPEPPSTHSAIWEFEVSGADGFRQKFRLEAADFRRSRGRVVVGRSAPFSHIQLRHDSVSRQHLHIELSDQGITIADRNSSNGTKINGQRLERPFQSRLLREGDKLQIGGLNCAVRRGF